MNETKFPEPVIDDGLFYSELYEMKKVDGWFERCWEDKPNPDDTEFNLYYNFTSPPVLFTHLEIKYLRAFESWFKKWFSQFGVFTKRREE